MKADPISFPGMPNIVVKNASSKEERDANKNFMKSSEAFNYGMNNLNIQFNCLYYNEDIKTDIDLDKEIRLFIKVVMLMDFSPKDVLVDLESMSGLVQFEKFKDYNLFLRKYQDLCEKQMPYFQCVPYNYPFPSEENQSQNYNVNNNMFNNNPPPMLYGPKSIPPMPPDPFGDDVRGNNNFRNMNINNSFQNFNNNYKNNNFQSFQNIPQENDNNANPYPNLQYSQNFSQKNNNNNKYYNGGNKNNGSGNFSKNRYNNNNNKRQNYNYNNNYNNQNNNNNRRYNQRNNYSNNNNDNNNNNINNNNNNKKYIIRPGDNIDLSNMKSAMQNVYQMNNPFMRQQMMPKPQFNRNYQSMNQNNNNYFNEMNKKNEIDLVAQRNLEKLNPSQLHSQFNKPPINVYPNMLNSNEQEEIRMEIADSIYEIVYAKYPHEASKITGMINEKGIEKMNMLLSKKEDLDEIIEKAYEMIMNSRNNDKNEQNFG
jgi:hypothetical protein